MKPICKMPIKRPPTKYPEYPGNWPNPPIGPIPF